jgi:hypothetical protein
MLISLASHQRLCFSRILLVAFIFVLSGSMNTFLDGRLVLWKQSALCLAPAPNVQPMSRIPDLFFSFLFHFAAILFCHLGACKSVTADKRCSAFVCSMSLSSCSLLGRTAGTNNCLYRLQGFLLNYLLLCLCNYSTSPVPVRLAQWRSWTIYILGIACLHWS